MTQPTQHWTEEERVRVCQHLSGVINHVRLLLIDSQVFAEEVEPTGAVPIELSLERYEFFNPDRSSGTKPIRYGLPGNFLILGGFRFLHFVLDIGMQPYQTSMQKSVQISGYSQE